jgi:hypothetical protein
MELNMQQEIYASIRVRLPEDVAESAARHAGIARAWADMIEQLGGLDGVQSSVSISEVRTPRKSRSPNKPRLVETPPPEAA